MCMEYNVYCDESCYMLDKDGDFMVIGAVYCPKKKIKEITNYILELKKKYGINKFCELKWTKVSKSKENFYDDLIKYFFIEDDLKFRAIVCDKRILNHELYNQTHDQWYHKMYYDMLRHILQPYKNYKIYIDIKDTIGCEKVCKLKDILQYTNKKIHIHIKIFKVFYTI